MNYWLGISYLDVQTDKSKALHAYGNTMLMYHYNDNETLE